MYNMGYGGKLPQYSGITKSAVTNAISQYCMNCTRIQPTNIVMLEDYPSDPSGVLRHACINGGISLLNLNAYNYPIYDKQGILIDNMTVHFYFCNYCGKLFIVDSFFKS